MKPPPLRLWSLLRHSQRTALPAVCSPALWGQRRLTRTAFAGMRVFVRAILTPILFLSLASTPARAQVSGKISKIEIKHIGPASVSDELIRANIRVKVGDPYLRTAVDDDVRNLYATGLFYNIRVADEITPEGVALIYGVQGNPRLTEIKFQ